MGHSELGQFVWVSPYGEMQSCEQMAYFNRNVGVGDRVRHIIKYTIEVIANSLIGNTGGSLKGHVVAPEEAEGGDMRILNRGHTPTYPRAYPFVYLT